MPNASFPHEQREWRGKLSDVASRFFIWKKELDASLRGNDKTINFMTPALSS
jgi:hypothetical protein